MSEELKQEIMFTGSMNAVSDTRLLPQGDYLPGTRNVKIGSTSGNTLGSVQTFEGNIEIEDVTALLVDDGIYKAVGQVADIKNKATIMMVWNSESGIFYRNIPTAVTVDTVEVITEAWDINQWQNYDVRIVSGTGVNQVRKIVSNTATTLNLESDWDIIPNNYSQFVIEKKGHQIIRYHYDTGRAERLCYEPCLGFKRDSKIHSIDVINGLLYWVQDDEPQKKLNIDKAAYKDVYNFNLYVGTDNPGKDTTYRIKISGTFPGPATIPLIEIDYGYVPGDTLREVLKTIESALNSNADFIDNGFSATYQSDSLLISNNLYAPLIVSGGIWDVFVSSTYGDFWWVGQNFYNYINEETLDVIKWPSWIEPQIQLKYDPNFLYNYLKGTRFQFAVKYLYDDFEVSKYSPFSIMALDTQISGDDLTNTNRNYIELDFSDNGRMQAKRNILIGVDIAVRDANDGVFKKVASLTKSQLTGTYKFYNDASYQTLNISETQEGQDFIPRSSKTQEILQNRLNYANNLSGFDNVPIDVKMNVDYTPGEAGPATYSITGKINIRNLITDTLESITSKKFGGFEIPENGFTVFLAGTSFKAVTVQSGTDQNFVITGVPNGRYYLRVASHLCKNGGVTWGKIYDTSNSSDLSWQNTSTFVRSTSRIIGIEVNDANVNITGTPIVIDSIPSTSSTELVGNPQLEHIYGYVYDGQNPYIGIPVSGSNIRNGLAMELAYVEWKYYRATATVQGTVNAVNVTLKTVDISSAVGLSIGDVLYFKITPGTADGIAATITNIAGLVLTLDVAISSGYVGTNVYRTSLQTKTVNADERGYFYLADTDATYPVVKWSTVKSYYDYEVIKSVLQSYYIGNISPDTAILVASTGNNTFDIGSALSQANSMIFTPNYNQVITSTYRSTLQVSIKDDQDNPIENILVSFSANARQTITDQNGVAKIIVYGYYDTVAPVERPGKIILGNPSQFNIVTYTVNLHTIAIGEFDMPPYSNGNPFLYEFTGVKLTRIISYPKHGSKYKLGIMYLDRGNRRGYVNASAYSELSIPFWVPNEIYRYLPLVSWEINHRPPIWATHYTWVRTKNLSYNSYLQIPIQGVEYILDIKEDGTVTTTTYGANDAKYIDINIKTLQAYKNEYEKSILAYSFSEGDRLRLIKNELNDFYSQYVDFEIISYDTETFKVRVKNILTAPEIKMDSTTKAGPVIEIYSPVKLAQESVYFEVCETLEIGNPYTENRFHRAPVEDQAADLSVTAKGTISSWDTYIMKRTINIYASSSPSPETRYYESAYISDFIANSDDSNIGRQNIINLQAKQQWLDSEIRHSNPILINTQTNGLSTWDNESREMLNIMNGPISKIIGLGYIMFCYQSFKRTCIYIGRVFAQSADGGTGTLTTIKGYYGSINPSPESYGCQHPESIVSTDNSIYFFDIINACVVRDTGQGMTSISDQKMYTYFSEKADQAYTIGSKARVYSVYDAYYNELYYSFVDESDSPDETYNDTIIYLEKEGNFKEQLDLYKINPEDSAKTYPDYFGFRGKVLVSWLNGTMWMHNAPNAIPANFYGTQHTPQVKFSANLESPDLIKVFTDITVNANKVWYAPQDTDIIIPPTALYPTGMKSRLLENKLKLKEGVFYSEFLCDLFTPNVTNPILNGRKLRGYNVIIRLQSKVETPENTDSVLMSVIVKGTPSPKTP